MPIRASGHFMPDPCATVTPVPASANAYSPGSSDVLASAHPNNGITLTNVRKTLRSTGDLVGSSGSYQGVVT